MPGGAHDTLEISPDPAELARTRRFVSERAADCGLDDEARFRAALVATEAVTNAMRHGRAADGRETPIEIRCGRDGDSFVIEVGDRGTFKQRLGDPAGSPEEATSGRGLGLIERLTSSFDLETSSEGTRVRMLVGLEEAC
ncbi:MAG: ATP-binding protein [Thermoleophilaceae bacterium]|nr:ATP-binding protein [Thermoleophilaceae bacterium]